MSTAAGDRLMVVLRKTAQELASGRRRDLDALLDHIVVSAVSLIDAADEGGLTRTEHLTGSARHATSEVVHQLDELQSELGEGPCIWAADGSPPDGMVLVGDLAGDDGARWPKFAVRAVECGFRSMLSVPFSPDGGRRRSSLNLYSRRPEAFTADDRQTAAVFGLQAGTLLYGADAAEGMRLALVNRDVIGRAKGLLMERFTLTDEAAFRMLVRSSQETNIKLVEVARWLTEDADSRAQARGGDDATAT